MPASDLHPEAQFTTGLLRPSPMWHSLIQAALDLIFPPCCVNCGRVDAQWCARCWHDLAAFPVSPAFRQVTAGFAAASSGPHDGILRQAVHALKYENFPAVAALLGSRLSETLAQVGWTVDAVVPVPLGEQRLKERGYNQAQHIAEALARTSGIPCWPDALRRARETQSQVGLNAQERRENMAAAFVASPHHCTGRHLLIVDDVLTTGATLAACAEALITAGALSSRGLTVTAASSP